MSSDDRSSVDGYVIAGEVVGGQKLPKEVFVCVVC